ncbi:MAG: DNRLRE domain-containing protein [bacterium]
MASRNSHQSGKSTLRKGTPLGLFGLLFSLVLASSVFSQPTFTRHTIDNNLRGAYWVYAKDIDKDGDIDLVSASFDGTEWWENDGTETFSKHFLGTLQGSWGAHADDIDNDGDVDILGCSPAEDITILYRNKGAQTFSKIIVDDRGLDPERVFTADIDGDGDKDILVPVWENRDLVWYENRGDAFRKHTIDGNLAGAHSIYAADFDGDGELDVVGSGSSKTRWYRNNGGGSFTGFTIDFDGGWSVNAADIDHDGDMDFVRTQRDNGDVDWYENDGDGTFIQHNIEQDYGQCWSAVAGDIDGDGDLDVAAAGFDANNIKVWFNLGDGSFGTGIVVQTVNTPRAVFIQDLDGDGDGDIAAAIRGDRDLVWYEVDGVPPPIGTIAVTSPNGGETLTDGQTANITWSSTGPFANVAIDLSVDNGSTWTSVASNTSNDGSMSWTVPGTVSNTCLIKIYDAADGFPSDTSDDVFAIQGASTPMPEITAFTPTSGAPGAEVTVFGNNLSGVTSVQFNGTAASFGVQSDGEILAVVPVGATTGKLSVSGSAGTGQSANDFAVTSGNGGTLSTFLPIEDARVKASRPDNNYGSSTKLYVEQGQFKSYLKFDVQGVSGRVTRAVLRLRVDNASDDGGTIYLASNNYAGTNDTWDEKNLTYNNSPEIISAGLSSIGAVVVGQQIEFDVTAVVAGNGLYSFCLANTSTNKVNYFSKEGSVTPQLVIETDDTGGPAQYSLTVGEQGAGSVALDPAGGTYDENTVVRLTATADAGWQFSGWSGDLNGSQNPATLLMDGNKTVTAIFTESGGSQALSFSARHDGQVKLTDAGANYGTKSTTKVEVNKFVSYFKFDVSGLTGSVQSARLRLYVTGASVDGGEIYAVSNHYLNTTTPWEESLLTSGNAPRVSGAPLASLGKVTANQFVEVKVTSGVPGNGTFSFAIKNNSKDLAKFYTKEGAFPPELIVETGTGGGTTQTLSVSTQGAGTVTLNPAGGVYDQGTPVQLTATPDAGWQFSGWSGDLSGAANPASITMDADKQVTATFTEVSAPQYTLTVTTQGSGSVALDPAGGVYDDGTQVQLTALPAAGWQFNSWNGDLTGTETVKTVSMTSHKNVSATFTEQSGGGNAITFTPIEDSQVKSTRPTRSYGGEPVIRVRKGSPTYMSYLKFDVSGLPGPVTRATIRLYVLDEGPDGGSVYSVSNHYKGTNAPWDEDGLVWDNAPVIDGAGLSSAGPVQLGTWIELDVTQAVVGNGVVSFGMLNNASNSVKYSSSEGDHKPELVVASDAGSGAENSPPVAVDDNETIEPGLAVVTSVAENDFDPDGTVDVTTITIIDQPADGSVSVNPFSGLVTYLPGSNFSGSDSFTYTIRDNDGATSNIATVTVQAAGGGGTVTLTFGATEDSQVKVTEPGRNYGAKTTTKVEKNMFRSYFKFDLTGITGPVQNARLRLFVTGASVDGGSVYQVSNQFFNSTTPWQEETLTAGNAPQISGAPISTLGAVPLDTFVECDVTAAVDGNGVVSFAVASTTTDQARYSTREGLHPPKLIVDFSTTSSPVSKETEDGITLQRPSGNSTAPVLPDRVSLSQNYPNPFNAGTTIEYALPQRTHVKIIIYNLLGQQVRILVDGVQAAGFKKVQWNGRNKAGHDVGTGVYFVRLVVGERKLIRKITLQK